MAAGALVGSLPANPRTLVVIPTYNERESIGALLREVRKVADVDVLVVDDGSPDGTADVVAAVRAGDAAVNLLARSRRLGLATAYLAGFDHAAREGYDLVFEMDADFSHPPRYLPVFLERIREADLVVGSRYVPGGGISSWSVIRRLISRGGNLYARAVLGSNLCDLIPDRAELRLREERLPGDGDPDRLRRASRGPVQDVVGHRPGVPDQGLGAAVRSAHGGAETFTRRGRPDGELTCQSSRRSP